MLDASMAILFFVSLMAFLFFIISLPVKLIFKKGMEVKKMLIGMGAAIALMFLALIFAPDLTPEEKAALAEKKEQRELAKQEEQERKDKEKAKEQKEKEEREKKEKEKKVQKEEDQQKTDSSEQKIEKKDTKEEKKEPKKEKKKKITFENAKDSKSLTDLLIEVNDLVEKVELEDNIAIITYSEYTTWSETSAYKDFAKDSSYIMNKLQDNDNIDGIGFVQMMEMMDEKGNESVKETIVTYYEKDNYDEINFGNFTGNLYLDASNFYKISDGYWIHPGIFMNVKDDALNGLPFTADNISDGFDTVFNSTNSD